MEDIRMRTTVSRFEPFRGVSSLQDQINRLFNEAFDGSSGEANLTSWAPPVDIYETAQELVVKADLPDVKPEDLDIRVENHILTIRGERKFEKKVNEDNYLRVERSYGSFSQLLSREHREHRGNQGRVQRRRLDPLRSEARGSQAQADQGPRAGPGSGRGSNCRQVIREAENDLKICRLTVR